MYMTLYKMLWQSNVPEGVFCRWQVGAAIGIHSSVCRLIFFRT